MNALGFLHSIDSILKPKPFYRTVLRPHVLYFELFRRLLDNATDYETGVHGVTGHALPRFMSMFVYSGRIRDFVKGEEMLLWKVSGIGSEIVGPVWNLSF